MKEFEYPTCDYIELSGADVITMSPTCTNPPEGEEMCVGPES